MTWVIQSVNVKLGGLSYVVKLHVPPLPVASPLLPTNGNQYTGVEPNIQHSIRLHIKPASRVQPVKPRSDTGFCAQRPDLESIFSTFSTKRLQTRLDSHKKPPTVTIKIKQQETQFK